jgi:hypothetical protein
MKNHSTVVYLSPLAILSHLHVDTRLYLEIIIVRNDFIFLCEPDDGYRSLFLQEPNIHQFVLWSV